MKPSPLNMCAYIYLANGLIVSGWSLWRHAMGGTIIGLLFVGLGAGVLLKSLSEGEIK
jgi:hypothetical protein